MPRFDTQRFAIIGAGRSGLGAARLAQSLGAAVTVFDEGDPEKLAGSVAKFRELNMAAVIGPAARDFAVNPGAFDQVIISPGLDARWPLPKKFTDAGVPLVGEMEFAFHLTDMPMIAITGTNGKSTCTELIAAIFNGCRKRSLPCGNHGMPLSEVVVTGERYDVLSLEVSSFQLETIQTFRAGVNIWLNFAPDHLDRYPNVQEYFDAKARLFENVTHNDFAIVRAGEAVSSGSAKRLTFSATGMAADYTYRNGTFYRGGDELGSAGGIRLRGRHNMENILAATMAGEIHGLAYPEMLKAVADYEPPRHRCELVREWNHREFINDSKATNLHALEACINSLDRPLVLIAGGKDKQLDYRPLRSSLNGRVSKMVLIGEIAQQLKETFGDLVPCQVAKDMDDAVGIAAEVSVPGDAVVLSPGTSSFDMFTSYAHRGEVFRAAVHALT